MNDRLTNEELRTAIRETEKTVGMTVGTNNTDAKVHLDTLRMVERNRSTALLAAANERAGRLEAQMVELREAWGNLCTATFADSTNAEKLAEATFERILGGA